MDTVTLTLMMASLPVLHLQSFVQYTSCQSHLIRSHGIMRDCCGCGATTAYPQVGYSARQSMRLDLSGAINNANAQPSVNSVTSVTCVNLDADRSEVGIAVCLEVARYKRLGDQPDRRALPCERLILRRTTVRRCVPASRSRGQDPPRDERAREQDLELYQ